MNEKPYFPPRITLRQCAKCGNMLDPWEDENGALAILSFREGYVRDMSESMWTHWGCSPELARAVTFMRTGKLYYSPHV